MSTFVIKPRSWENVKGQETTRFDAFDANRLIAWATVDTTHERWSLTHFCVEPGGDVISLRLRVLSHVIARAAELGASIWMPER